jgi:hypothetical protein
MVCANLLPPLLPHLLVLLEGSDEAAASSAPSQVPSQVLGTVAAVNPAMLGPQPAASSTGAASAIVPCYQQEHLVAAQAVRSPLPSLPCPRSASSACQNLTSPCRCLSIGSAGEHFGGVCGAAAGDVAV